MVQMTPPKFVQVVLYPDGRMDTHNTSIYMGLSEKTLAMQRCDGTGPHFVKRGRIFYFQADVDAWINANGRHLSTAQAKIHAKPPIDDPESGESQAKSFSDIASRTSARRRTEQESNESRAKQTRRAQTVASPTDSAKAIEAQGMEAHHAQV